MAFEELRGIGPQDPDVAGETAGRAAGRVNAIRLAQDSARAHPPELRAAQSLPFDESRTRTLDLEEVRKVADDLKDSFLTEDDVVEDASVRGSGDRTAVVLICRRSPADGRADPEAGRSFKAMVPYKDCKRSVKAFERLRDAAEQQGAARGPVTDSADLSAAEDEVRSLREQVKALEEAQLTTQPSAPEPYEGYGDANAPDIVEYLKESGREDLGLRGLEQLVAYEEAHDGRVTVVKAAQDAAAEQPSQSSQE